MEQGEVELQVDYLIQDQMELQELLLYLEQLHQQEVVLVNQPLDQDQPLDQVVQEVEELVHLVLDFHEGLHKVEQVILRQ